MALRSAGRHVVLVGALVVSLDHPLPDHLAVELGEPGNSVRRSTVQMMKPATVRFRVALIVPSAVPRPKVDIAAALINIDEIQH